MKQLVLCSLLVVLLGAGQLHAVPIFSTLGPGDTYHTTTGWTIGSPGNEFDQGDQFAIAVATPHRLDSIEVAIGLISGTNSVDVWLMSDAAGQPGATIEAFNFKNMGPFATSPLLTGNSVLNPILTPGTNYWLIASAPSTNDTWAAWNWSLPVVNGSHASRQGVGAWTVTPNQIMSAFRVNGSPVGVIPAPGAILLGGIGAGLVGYLRRRRTL